MITKLKDLECMLRDLVEAADGNVEDAERGIIFIDEIDKCSRKGENVSTTADPTHDDLQYGLLKFIEGSEVTVPKTGMRLNSSAETFKINTENILFIVGGAFEGIDKIIAKRMRKHQSIMGFGAKIELNEEKAYDEYISNVTAEDLKAYGIVPELLGRLPVISYTKSLDEDALVKILTEPKNSLVMQYQTIFSMHNALLDFSEEALRVIAKRAIERKTGARALRSIMEDILLDTMFDIPNNNGEEKGYIVDVDENENITIEEIATPA